MPIFNVIDDFLEIFKAFSSTTLSRSLSFTTSLIKPISAAFLEEIRSPFKSISIECLFETVLDKATIGVEQNKPILTPGVGIKTSAVVIGYGFTTLYFIGAGNTFAVSGTTVDISIAGGGGSGGGVSETETAVSSTSATTVGTFTKTGFRSASILAQITQGSAYQVGRYLLIHDGTTVTTIEESAVATGSMLGTFEGVIDGSDVDFNVTMSSSSSATVTVKLDTISIP